MNITDIIYDDNTYNIKIEYKYPRKRATMIIICKKYDIKYLSTYMQDGKYKLKFLLKEDNILDFDIKSYLLNTISSKVSSIFFKDICISNDTTLELME